MAKITVAHARFRVGTPNALSEFTTFVNAVRIPVSNLWRKHRMSIAPDSRFRSEEYQIGRVSTPVIVTAPADRSIHIREVRNKHDRDEFVRFPWQIYQRDAAWVPPLLIERKEFIDPRRHPFYQHGEAVQLLAERQGKVVGRIMASDDPRYNCVHHSSVGCFGLFECIDDVDVAQALIGAAQTWLVRRGRTTLRGPIDYSMNYSCGLLVDGYDTPPRVMMNHNPPYYVALFQACGLTKAKDLYAWWFDDPHDMARKWRRRVERSGSHGIRVRQLRRQDLEAEVMRCKTIYNQAWQKSWGACR